MITKASFYYCDSSSFDKIKAMPNSNVVIPSLLIWTRKFTTIWNRDRKILFWPKLSHSKSQKQKSFKASMKSIKTKKISFGCLKTQFLLTFSSIISQIRGILSSKTIYWLTFSQIHSHYQITSEFSSKHYHLTPRST